MTPPTTTAKPAKRIRLRTLRRQRIVQAVMETARRELNKHGEIRTDPRSVKRWTR